MDERSGELENVVIDPQFWRGKRVLITGHTGFKGGWASLLLTAIGAEVYGFAFPAESPQGVFMAARVGDGMNHSIGDIREIERMHQIFADARPDIVIHMAAQALVRQSYDQPVETYATNVMGTVHLLEAARRSPSVRAIVVVTSDKCYENLEDRRPFRETDPMGGSDPYSNSKGCAELVTDSYRRSFFNGVGTASVATGRAGNVIGGGDWSRDRLVPDAMRAFAENKILKIRNPHSIRPWQHVMDPILAYLSLAEKLMESGDVFAEGWNFGPSRASEVPVRSVVDRLVELWGKPAEWTQDGEPSVAEAASLKLDCTKASERLHWHPLISLDDALRLTVDWHRAQLSGKDMQAVTLEQIREIVRS